MRDPRREIPAIDRILGTPGFTGLLEAEPRPLVTDALAAVQERLRAALGSGHPPAGDWRSMEWHLVEVRQEIARLRAPSLRRVINATGVVLHTNLGRAPLAPQAVEAVRAAAAGYSNLEYDLEQGSRGSRYAHCTRLLRRVTGAQDALVVNNNAAALVLALNTFAAGRETLVSRGELVEIGGSFRIPSVAEKSATRLREVGTTNRTHLDDYEAALGPMTGAILKVHPSNFRISGYTAEVGIRDLAELGTRNRVTVIHDLGSGLLVDPAWLGLPTEPTARNSLDDGAHIVCISGDKLLGGPQAGILLGSVERIRMLRQNPLSRALRVDKLTLAALEATLALYVDRDTALRNIPVLRMLSEKVETLDPRAAELARRLVAGGVPARCATSVVVVGGGSMPDAAIPSRAVLIDGDHARELERELRRGETPLVGRLAEDALWLDVRTIMPDEDALVAELVVAAWQRLDP
jgi:L-seryl-tRNA(Ser) seleniumtransferase